MRRIKKLKCKAHCPSTLVKLSGVNSFDEDGEYGDHVDGSEASAITATEVTLECRLDGQESRTPTASQTPATRPVSSVQALLPASHAAAAAQHHSLSQLLIQPGTEGASVTAGQIDVVPNAEASRWQMLDLWDEEFEADYDSIAQCDDLTFDGGSGPYPSVAQRMPGKSESFRHDAASMPLVHVRQLKQVTDCLHSVRTSPFGPFDAAG
jgi:hypothetical protein